MLMGSPSVFFSAYTLGIWHDEKLSSMFVDGAARYGFFVGSSELIIVNRPLSPAPWQRVTCAVPDAAGRKNRLSGVDFNQFAENVYSFVPGFGFAAVGTGIE